MFSKASLLGSLKVGLCGKKLKICYLYLALFFPSQTLDKSEIQSLKREKEALEKQVALINGQMLLVEGGKKRLDDVVDDLQTEIVSLRQQLEEAEKK